MSVQHDPEGVELKYLHEIAPIMNAQVLEIGCGEGRLMWRYAAGANHVTGFDLKPERLIAAQQNCPVALRSKVALTQTTANALPFRSEHFGLAILGWSL